MKINPIHEAFRFVNSVREKKDEDRGGQQHQNQDQKKREEEAERFAVDGANEGKVGEAVESFQQDAQTQAQGLQAALSGQGPGLRVILKDGSGAIVRQFTGEEFLRLREAVSKEGRTRGKILDQKL